MKNKYFIPAALVGLGIFIGFLVVALSMKAMVHTSTPSFCGSCHEIKRAVSAWSGSTHAQNGRGLMAECMDCHLPPPEETLRFFAMKTYHGLKDVTSHLLRGASGYDREKAREGVYREVTNAVCQRCHGNILHMPDNRGAMLAHRSVVYARQGYEKRCIDCHYDLVHNDPALVMYRPFGIPYQARGLKPNRL